jgi:hypothetical protein
MVVVVVVATVSMSAVPVRLNVIVPRLLALGGRCAEVAA